MSSGKVKCTCGWSWNKSDSSKKDMYICHECGRDNSNNMKNGGWLDKHDNIPQAQSGTEIDWDKVRSVNDNLGVQAAKMFDPTGITSYPDVYYAAKDLSEGKGSAGNLALNVLGALPMIGKAKTIFHLARVSRATDKVKKAKKVLNAVEKVAEKANDFVNYPISKLKPLAESSKVVPKVVGKAAKKVEKLAEKMGKPLSPKGQRISTKQITKSDIKNLGVNLLDTANVTRDATNVAGQAIDETKQILETSPLIDKTKTIKYYNTDPNRGEVEKPGMLANAQYVPISNSAELSKWKQQGKLKNGGWLDNYNDYNVSAPEEFEGDGYSNVGRNSSPAWGGQFQMGGVMPGAIGNMYARHGAPSEGKYAKKTLPSAQDGTIEKPINEDSPIQLDEIVITPISKRVKQQRDIVQKSKPKQNYSIVDKKNNIIHYYNPSGELINKENIITGASNKDEENALSMKEYFEKNNSNSHEDYFDYLKGTQNQTTPSGIFNIGALREDVAQNPDKIGSWFNKIFRPQREKDIENIRLQDYGNQQKLFTLTSEYGVPSSKAIHGTGRENRVEALNDDASDRNLSNGCINVNGETICFDTLQKGSGVYILPEENDELLYPNEKTSSGKGTNKVYTNTKSSIENALYSRGIKASKDAIDFISSVAEKETRGGRSTLAKLQDYAPYELAHSQGMFQINPDMKAFGNYLPQNFDGSMEASAEAIYNFYNKFKDLDPVQKYQEYRGGKDRRYDKAFKKIYDRMSKVYKNGGSIAQNGQEMKYYQEGLDFQPKTISKDGSIIKDDRGQWDHPGEITEIGSNDITMKGVPYDVLGISDTGDTKLMKPGKNYKFKGKKVTEYPMAKNGINQQDQKTLEHIDQLTNFTNYNKPTIGGWLNKYN